jgi:hypothetical protein
MVAVGGLHVEANIGGNQARSAQVSYPKLLYDI